MKSILLSIALACSLSAVGCTSTSAPSHTAQLAIAGEALATTETLLTAAEVAGVIPAKDAPAIQQADATARALFATAQAHAGDSGFNAAMAELQTALLQFVLWKQKYAPIPSPASQPTTRVN